MHQDDGTAYREAMDAIDQLMEMDRRVEGPPAWLGAGIIAAGFAAAVCVAAIWWTM